MTSNAACGGFTLALLMLAGAGAAQAHETWMLPSNASTPVEGTRVFGLTSGEGFPKPDTGPKAERVARLRATLGGRAVKAAVVEATPAELMIGARATGLGLLVVDVSLAPHDIDLQPEKVDEYFEEAGPTVDVRQAWRDMPAPRVWKESYVKNAKALQCLAACARDRSAMRPTGAHLEFVPLYPGARPRAYRLLAAGHALAGQQVEIVDASGAVTRGRTDRRGEVRIARPLKGWSMLSAVWLRLPSAPGGRFESDFASITFDAR